MLKKINNLETEKGKFYYIIIRKKKTGKKEFITGFKCTTENEFKRMVKSIAFHKLENFKTVILKFIKAKELLLNAEEEKGFVAKERDKLIDEILNTWDFELYEGTEEEITALNKRSDLEDDASPEHEPDITKMN